MNECTAGDLVTGALARGRMASQCHLFCVHDFCRSAYEVANRHRLPVLPAILGIRVADLSPRLPRFLPNCTPDLVPGRVCISRARKTSDIGMPSGPTLFSSTWGKRSGKSPGHRHHEWITGPGTRPGQCAAVWPAGALARHSRPRHAGRRKCEKCGLEMDSWRGGVPASHVADSRSKAVSFPLV